MSVAPRLSVVIIGRNEGERLVRCIASVKSMRFTGPVEILYVDSGSIDGSVASAAAANVSVISLPHPKPTAARGRNAGWRAASGDIILFLDGDTVLDPEFAAVAMAHFVDPAVAVVWGHRRELYSQHSIYNRVLDLDWIYAPGWTAFCGGDALFRRAALEAAGGFDETLIAGEEPELCQRLLGDGSRILHVDLPMTGHDLAVTRFSQYWQRATRAGHAYAEVAARFQSTENPFWRDDVERNRRRALLLLALLFAGILLALVLRRAWPVGVVTAAFLALALRTAWKSRWKSTNTMTLLLYGMHSHLQQVPIFFGQLRFLRNRRAGRSTQLVEYK